MGKDILLIEDRIERMNQFKSFDIDSCERIDLKTGKVLDSILEDIKNNNFESIENYECLIFHSSSLSDKHKNNIKEFCKKTDKRLVFFSGGITSSYYRDKPFPFLSINAKVFYQKNLEYFVENSDKKNINLLLLQFNNRWELNILLNTRNTFIKFWQHDSREKTIFVKEIVPNDYVKQALDLDFLASDTLLLDDFQLKKIHKKLDKIIFERVNE